jgi:hypothetical protein
MIVILSMMIIIMMMMIKVVMEETIIITAIILTGSVTATFQYVYLDDFIIPDEQQGMRLEGCLWRSLPCL